MNITYEEIEPFGGILREDTQEKTWDGFKKEFLKRNRKSGVYLYHKSASSTNFILFKVSPNGESRQLIPPSDGELIWYLYMIPSESETLQREARCIHITTYPDPKLKRFLKNLSDGRRCITSEERHKDAILWQDYLSKNVQIKGTPNRASGGDGIYGYAIGRGVAPEYYNQKKSEFWGYKHYIGGWRDKIRLEYDSEESNRISKDIGIITPDPSKSGTFMAYLKTPTMDTLLELGYTIGSIIDATSTENVTPQKYSDSTFKGKPEQNMGTVISDAIEASKKAEIGWASTPGK